MSNFGRPLFDVYVNVDYAYSEIMEGLFIGSELSAHCEAIFKKHNIERVLVVGAGLKKGLLGNVSICL